MEYRESMYRYWGKAQPRAAEGAQWHLLVYHSLDVAAAGKVLLEWHERLRRDLAKNLGLDEGTFLSWIAFFLALHDLGKFAEGFQNLNRDIFVELHGHPSNQPYSIRHDSLGFLFWEQGLWELLEKEEWLITGAGVRDRPQWKEGLAFWARAVTGHHGQPPKRRPNNSELVLGHHFSATDQQAAIAFARVVRQLLLPTATPVFTSSAKAFKNASKKVSWWLAGIAVLADWIGSNADQFHYRDKPMSLDDYWQEAQQNAASAIEKAGILPSAVSHGQGLGELFPALKSFPPTPLQQLAATLSLGNGPQLFILEDVTGAGKTEAAVLLAHRLMSAGLGAGIYLGLPTMATANAMYARMESVYGRLFTSEARPSLVLAHSARHLSEQFRKAILSPDAPPDSDYGEGEQSATARCTAWLADSRKKALLADMGVGTIDQALQAILYSKHQCLRLLGLFGKVLIVDEVHACDAYMHKLLQTLLAFHAASGGSAILLSATLPQGMREELVQAFCNSGRTLPKLVNEHYPLLTHIGGPDTTEYPLDTRPEVARRVDVRWVSTLEEVEVRISETIERGRCVCWIRNTVADARAAYAALSKRLPEDRIHLFHARFAMGDRLDIEQQVLARFGKNSTTTQRAGRVVIATQVVEQSLDLDFDLLISDLAPIDLLIQRAGRLCRHTRDEHGNPANGPDQRGTPCLMVYGPEPVEDAPQNWFSSVFPKAAPVYCNHGQLWLTARLLWERGGFRMPEDARALIEGVYGELAETSIPESLLERHWKAEGDALANLSQAKMNSIDLDAGYAIDSLDWWNDAVTPTRLGEPTSTVRLARWDGHQLTPWYSGEFAWDLSQVQIRQARIKATAEPIDPDLKAAVEAVKETLPDKGKWSVLLPLSEGNNGLWSGVALDGRGQEVRVFYDPRLGLLLNEEMEGESE